jgi:hypothetical protein
LNKENISVVISGKMDGGDEKKKKDFGKILGKF